MRRITKDSQMRALTAVRAMEKKERERPDTLTAYRQLRASIVARQTCRREMQRRGIPLLYPTNVTFPFEGREEVVRFRQV